AHRMIGYVERNNLDRDPTRPGLQSAKGNGKRLSRASLGRSGDRQEDAGRSFQTLAGTDFNVGHFAAALDVVGPNRPQCWLVRFRGRSLSLRLPERLQKPAHATCLPTSRPRPPTFRQPLVYAGRGKVRPSSCGPSSIAVASSSVSGSKASASWLSS